MKSIAIFLFLIQIHLISIAGITGVGGGSTIGNSNIKNDGQFNQVGKSVTVEVCGRGEGGNMCEKVTYIVRPPSPIAPKQVVCITDFERPCPEVQDTPKWLKKFISELYRNGNN